jgi:crotonobetainyl-CoA:carnitine CoA-transferase CaiB-like acyl-CoA transferase
VKDRNRLIPSEDATIGYVLQTRMPIGGGASPRSAPKLGEHNIEILTEFGFSREEITQLEKTETILN